MHEASSTSATVIGRIGIAELSMGKMGYTIGTLVLVLELELKLELGHR